MSYVKEDELLSEIIKSAKMGVASIKTLMPKVQDTKLKSELWRQIDSYRGVESKALDEVHSRGYMPEGINPVSQAVAWTSIQLNSIGGCNNSEVAEMMIDGSSMGIVEMTKTLSRSGTVDPKLSGLAGELIELEQKNIENMKSYL